MQCLSSSRKILLKTSVWRNEIKIMSWSSRDESNVALNSCSASTMYDMNHILSQDEKIENSKCLRLDEEWCENTDDFTEYSESKRLDEDWNENADDCMKDLK